LDAALLVKTRRSVRKFKPVEVSREVVYSVLDLARWAPSAHNAHGDVLYLTMRVLK